MVLENLIRLHYPFPFGSYINMLSLVCAYRDLHFHYCLKIVWRKSVHYHIAFFGL